VQIEDQVQGLTYHTTILQYAVYGGVPMDAQERALRAGVDIIVATPGRPDGSHAATTPPISALEILVLDEADRMLDMGFWPDVPAHPRAARRSGRRCCSRRRCRGSAEADSRVPADAAVVQIGRRGGPAQTILALRAGRFRPREDAVARAVAA
jgi:ATP-dependent RNA helicase RhlE